MQARHVAVLCIVTLAAGVYSLRHVEEEGTTAVAAGAGAAPELARAALPQTPGAPADPPTTVAGAVSLIDLARDLMAKATTSTTRARPATTTTTKRAAAASSPSPTTTAPSRAADAAPAPATSTTTPLTPLTTLLAKVAPPVAAVGSAVTRSDSGIASWFNAPDATCAHRTLPMGTVVKVTRIHNGAVTTCKVNDRGPTLETGRLIDLSLDTFEKLAAAEAGLIDVTIEW